MNAIAPQEHPILFSAPMVRALLDGSKTQTRRMLAPQPHRAPDGLLGHAKLSGYFAEHVFGYCFAKLVACPFGAAGDRLWVKEAIRRDPLGEGSTYIADGARTVADAWPWKPKALPGMYCPRGLSRIALEITSVRAQRLHDITAGDAAAEGASLSLLSGIDTESPDASLPFAVQLFARLWNSVNGKRPGCGWKANPWVWAITFEPRS